jgi:putative ABC transport system permease protein
MTVSIDLASGSASRAFALSTSAVTGKATHRIIGGPTGLDDEVYRQLRTALGFTPAAPVVEGYVLAQELGAQPMRLVGVDPFAEPPFRSYLSGEQAGMADLVLFLAEARAIIVAAPLARQYGLDLGDNLTLTVAGRDVAGHIVGLLEPADEVNRSALSSIIFTDIATAQEILAMNGRLSHIDLIVDDESEIALLEAFLPQGVRLEPASARSNTVQQMTAAFELNLTALSLLALVVGMFLIYNTVTFSVVQRRPLFGVLRSLGVTGDQLFRLILTEAAALSLIGSFLGLGLGILLGRGMVRLVTQTINDFYFVVNVQDIAIPSSSLLKGLLIGVLAAVLAAVLPAWEAMKTAPQNTLRRSSLESKTRRLLPWLVVAWLLLGGLGAFLLWLPGVSLVIAFAGLFAVLIAFALLTPPVTMVLMPLCASLGYRLLGAIGRLAPCDIVRSLSRTSVAIAALMVAVSVIIGVSIMIGSFRQTVTQWLTETLQADIYLAPPTLTASQAGGTLPPDVVVTAGAWPGVDYAVTARQVEVWLPELDRMAELVAASGDVSNGNRTYAWLDGSEAELWSRFAAGEGVMISEPLLLKENLPLPPEPITVMTPDGPRLLPVLAVIYDYSSDRGTILIDHQLYQVLWQDDHISTIALFVQPGAPVDEVAAGLRQAWRGRADVVIQLNQNIRNEALAIFDRTFAITAALRLLAVVVAFIGVLNALMSLQLERTRELGVLRATGMTRQQLWQLTLLETGLMGGTAGLLAIPTGFVLAWILIYVINVRSFGWTLQMNLEPLYFLQALVVALLAALLASIYPALLLGRMVIATAVRQE